MRSRRDESPRGGAARAFSFDVARKKARFENEKQLPDVVLLFYPLSIMHDASPGRATT